MRENDEREELYLTNLYLHLESVCDRFDMTAKATKEDVLKVLEMIEEIPVSYERILSSYDLRDFAVGNDELFYICDCGRFYSCIRSGSYASFIQLLEDFIQLKLLKDNLQSSKQSLPKNIKDALIAAIKEGLKAGEKDAEKEA